LKQHSKHGNSSISSLQSKNQVVLLEIYTRALSGKVSKNHPENH